MSDDLDVMVKVGFKGNGDVSFERLATTVVTMARDLEELLNGGVCAFSHYQS